MSLVGTEIQHASSKCAAWDVDSALPRGERDFPRMCGTLDSTDTGYLADLLPYEDQQVYQAPQLKPNRAQAADHSAKDQRKSDLVHLTHQDAPHGSPLEAH